MVALRCVRAGSLDYQPAPRLRRSLVPPGRSCFLRKQAFMSPISLTYAGSRRGRIRRLGPFLLWAASTTACQHDPQPPTAPDVVPAVLQNITQPLTFYQLSGGSES